MESDMTTETNASKSAPKSVELKSTLDLALRTLSEVKAEIGRHEGRALQGFIERTGDETFVPSAFVFADERARVERARTNKIRLQAAIGIANGRNRLKFKGNEITVLEAILLKSELVAKQTWVKSLRIEDRKDRQNIPTGNRDVHGPVYETKMVETKSRLSEKERTAELDELQADINALQQAINSANRRIQIKVELLE